MIGKNNYRVLKTCASCKHSVTDSDQWSDTRHCNLLKDRPTKYTNEYFTWLDKTRVDDSGVCDLQEDD
jgi:hypothetical protein